MSRSSVEHGIDFENTGSFTCAILKNLARIFTITEEIISLYFTGTVIVILVVAMCVEIVLRFTLNKSLLGLPEVVELAVVAITFTGLALVQRDDSHIKMDTLITWLMKRRVGHVVKFLTALSIAALFVIVSWVLAQYTLVAYEVGHTTWNIYMPIWPVYLLVTLASIIMLIRLIVQMKDHLLHILKNSKEPRGNLD